MAKMIYFGVLYDSVQLQQQTSTAPVRLMYRGVPYERYGPTPTPAYNGTLCYRGVQYRKQSRREEGGIQLVAVESPRTSLNRIWLSSTGWRDELLAGVPELKYSAGN